MAEAAARSCTSADCDTECAVCHEFFTEPKLLPCAHVVCRQCLVSWLSANQESVCPLCSCPVCDGKSDDWSAIVDALPTDRVMTDMIESALTLKKDHVCGGCRKSAAVSICLDCADMMCKTCAGVHKNLNLSRNHKIEHVSNVTVESLAASQPMYCSVHAGESTKLFCASHQAAICHECATTKHRSCPNITKLSEMVDKCRSELDDIVKALQKGEDLVEKVIKKLDSLLEQNEKKYEQTVADIDAKCDSMEKALKVCRQRLKDVALNSKLKSRDSMMSAKNCASAQHGMLTSHRLVTHRVSRSSSSSSITDMTCVLKQRAADLDPGSKLSTILGNVIQVTVTVDQQAVAEIEKKLAELRCIASTVNVADLGTIATCVPHSEGLGWRFHSNHGDNVSLSEDGLIAQRHGGFSDGIVISSVPINISTIYEVEVGTGEGWLPCGVTLQSPQNLVVPESAYNGWTEAVVVSDQVTKKGNVVKHGGDLVYGLNPGQRVGVLVDGNRALHLYKDGIDQGVMVDDVPSPSYPFFDLCHYNKITALPPRPIP